MKGRNIGNTISFVGFGTITSASVMVNYCCRISLSSPLFYEYEDDVSFLCLFHLLTLFFFLKLIIISSPRHRITRITKRSYLYMMVKSFRLSVNFLVNAATTTTIGQSYFAAFKSQAALHLLPLITNKRKRPIIIRFSFLVFWNNSIRTYITS